MLAARAVVGTICRTVPVSSSVSAAGTGFWLFPTSHTVCVANEAVVRSSVPLYPIRIRVLRATPLAPFAGVAATAVSVAVAGSRAIVNVP